jgi:hypothetical protein
MTFPWWQSGDVDSFRQSLKARDPCLSRLLIEQNPLAHLQSPCRRLRKALASQAITGNQPGRKLLETKLGGIGKSGANPWKTMRGCRSELPQVANTLLQSQ